MKKSKKPTLKITDASKSVQLQTQFTRIVGLILEGDGGSVNEELEKHFNYVLDVQEQNEANAGFGVPDENLQEGLELAAQAINEGHSQIIIFHDEDLDLYCYFFGTEKEAKQTLKEIEESLESEDGE